MSGLETFYAALGGVALAAATALFFAWWVARPEGNP